MTGKTSGNGADKGGQRGFVFPGRFTITAVGDTAGDLKARVPELLESVGIKVLHETVRHRHSREGNYISVTVDFDCPSREAYEAAHTVLRADEAIKYTL
ncbi:MAG TPA: DUF493 family protein [Rhodanobacteraceae bacterium]|nr:DUF493 family protein [Rhodanobacteraceae bacterium]